MKRHIRGTAVLLAVFVLAASLSLTAYAEKSGDYEYTLNENGGAVITAYRGSERFV